MTGEQISMFEPTGEELASLASTALIKAFLLAKRADNLADRGLLFAGRGFVDQSRRELDRAATFETAYQFEKLAGLA
jgi:hypothetical protein